MKFGPVAPIDARDGVTVHTLRQDELVLKKGTRIGNDEIVALERAGVREVVVVRLEDGDISEDEAAGRLAMGVAGKGVRAEGFEEWQLHGVGLKNRTRKILGGACIRVRLKLTAFAK